MISEIPREAFERQYPSPCDRDRTLLCMAGLFVASLVCGAEVSGATVGPGFCGGGHGRSARRLVCRHGAVSAAARSADSTHADHSTKQGANRLPTRQPDAAPAADPDAIGANRVVAHSGRVDNGASIRAAGRR
jgi:hypothetical protein